MLAARASIRWVCVGGLLALAAFVATRDHAELAELVLEEPAMDAPEIASRTSNVMMTIDEELARRRAIEAILATPVNGSQPNASAGLGDWTFAGLGSAR